MRSAIAATAEHPDAKTQAQQFIEQFTARYGDRHPNWVEESWRQAATVAHQQFKFLFVYLHSPKHEDTDSYVRNVLCSSELVDYVNQQFVCWGGDVRKPDAFNLSGRLSISTYPCIALLAFSGTRTKLVAAAQGKVRPQQLMAALQRAVNDQGLLLMAERLEQEERVSSSRESANITPLASGSTSLFVRQSCPCCCPHNPLCFKYVCMASGLLPAIRGACCCSCC